MTATRITGPFVMMVNACVVGLAPYSCQSCRQTSHRRFGDRGRCAASAPSAPTECGEDTDRLQVKLVCTARRRPTRLVPRSQASPPMTRPPQLNQGNVLTNCSQHVDGVSMASVARAARGFLAPPVNVLHELRVLPQQHDAGSCGGRHPIRQRCPPLEEGVGYY